MSLSLASRYEKIISGKVNYPESFSKPLEDLISKLLTKNPSKRLGNMKGGLADVTKHRWFGPFDWKGLHNGTINPPYVPDLEDFHRRLEEADEEQDEEDEEDALNAVSARSTPNLCLLTRVRAGGERLGTGTELRGVYSRKRRALCSVCTALFTTTYQQFFVMRGPSPSCSWTPAPAGRSLGWSELVVEPRCCSKV